MSIRALKKHLSGKSQAELISEVVELYKGLSQVKEFYQMHIDPKATRGIAEKYKKIIINQFYPARGDPKLQYSVARKALTDFMKVCKDPSAIIDMKLTYVDAGLDCTLMYGDIDEEFYFKMGTMFESALKDVAEFCLFNAFRDRCKGLVNGASDIGWGFGDALADMFEECFISLVEDSKR
jgi:hypothetical protein